jgi:hypothetical protein
LQWPKWFPGGHLQAIVTSAVFSFANADVTNGDPSEDTSNIINTSANLLILILPDHWPCWNGFRYAGLEAGPAGLFVNHIVPFSHEE